MFLRIKKESAYAIFLFLTISISALASPEWMKKVADGKKLSELSILGTHNSGALHGGDYAQCQTLSIRAQLDLGVRFLDIRCRTKQGEFHIHHGISNQKMKFSEVRDICEKFLIDHPSETILMSIKDEGSKGLKAGDFGKILKKTLAGHNGRWHQQSTIPTLCQTRGKVVIISRNRDIKGIPWRAFQVQDRFWISKSNTLNDKWKKITEHFERLKPAQPGINFISCTGFLSPPDFNASSLNLKLIDFLKKNPQKHKGIIVVDFVTKEMFPALNTPADDKK